MDAQNIRILVPPPPVTVGRQTITFVGVLRKYVLGRPSWRASTELIGAWLVLEEIFTHEPNGRWGIPADLLEILCVQVRCLEQDLSQLPSLELRMLMHGILMCDAALMRAPQEPEPEGEAAAPEAEGEQPSAENAPDPASAVEPATEAARAPLEPEKSDESDAAEPPSAA